MAAPYSVPQARIFQEFAPAPAPVANPQRALIAGPQAFLLRYGVAAEKALGKLGAYDPDAAVAYSWPALPLGALLDPAYTAVHIDGARLTYFSDLEGADDVVAPVAGQRNQVRIADATYGFKSHGSFPRFPALGDRDVQPGDTVTVRGVVGGVSYDLTTYVLGLAADQVAAAVAAPTADPANGTTRTASSTVTQTAGTVNCNTLVADLTGYSAWSDGFLDDTYTVTVIAGSGGGDLSTARLRITSASGKDDALEVTPGQIDDLFTFGRRGLQLRFTCTGHSNASLSTDDLVAGQTWTVVVHDDYTALAASAGGTYKGAQDTTYLVTCTQGGTFGSTTSPPQVTVSTTTGIDLSGPTTVTGLNTALALGTQGATVTFTAGPNGLRLGDRFYIKVTAAADGRFGTLVLGHNLPTALSAATDLDLTLSLTRDITVPGPRAGFAPQTNWTQTQAGLTVAAGILATDPALTSGGTLVPTPVTAGTLYVQYRAWQQTHVTAIGGISDASQIEGLLGPIDPDNPLAEGVFRALLNANGAEVKYLAVADPADPAAWSALIARLVGQRDLYNLVPLTHDATVLGLFAAHVASQSAPDRGRWRGLFVSPQAQSVRPVVTAGTTSDGTVALATIAADPDALTTVYTLLTVPAGNAHFLANGVAVGDTVRYDFTTVDGAASWTEYTVARVVNEDTLLLAAGPAAAAGTPLRVEVWHTLTPDEVAADLAAQAARYASTRVCAVWPDQIGSGGVTLDGYFLAAALGGLASGVVPQQDLTNRPIAGFDDVGRTTRFFNADQLDVLGGGGLWVVTQDPDGTVKTRDAVTTDTTTRDASSEMLRRNLDAISFYFLDTIAPFVGTANNTPSALARIQIELVSAIESLKGQSAPELLGPPLIDAQIVQLRPDAVLADTVVAVLRCDLPRAIKHFDVHLVVS